MHIFPKYRVTEKRNAKRDEAIGLKWPFQAKITDRSAICHVSTYYGIRHGPLQYGRGFVVGQSGQALQLRL